MGPDEARLLRIFLIDDHPVVRDGFARAAASEPDIDLCGSATDAAEGFSGARAAKPDIVLLDLSLPDRDGQELIADLRTALPEARVVVLSGHDDEYRVAEALRAGAHGYLLKTTPLSDIIAGIRLAARGGTPLSPSLTDAVLRAMHRTGKAGSGTIEALTARELQVMRLFASGLSTREVAKNLGISPKTVETHRIRIYDKLGAKSVVDLTRIAVRTGLVRA